MEKEVRPEQYFHTRDGAVLASLEELQEYLKKASDEHLHHHVDGMKNDFANWVRHVFEDADLADKLEHAKDRASLLAAFGAPAEKSWEPTEKKEAPKQEPERERAGEEETQEPKKKLSLKSLFRKRQKRSILPDSGEKTGTGGEAAHRLKRESFEEHVKQVTSFLDKRDQGPDMVTPEQLQEDLESYKQALTRLNEEASDLRKEGKNPFIPDIIIRNTQPKLAIYRTSRKTRDKKVIEDALARAEAEIKDVQAERVINLKKEIEEQLEKEGQQEGQA